MRYNRSFDTDTQRHRAASVLVSVRFSTQCHCVPVNSDVRPHKAATEVSYDS